MHRHIIYLPKNTYIKASKKYYQYILYIVYVMLKKTCIVIFFKGRTLDFTVDLTSVPIIGQKYVNVQEFVPEEPGPPLSPARKGSNHMEIESNWRRPQASQVCISIFM